MSKFLIIGGCGFIGRHLLAFLLEHGAGYIRIADKTLPMLCQMPAEVEALYENPKVEFIQADMTKDDFILEVFKHDGGFDYVINLAAETMLGLTQEVYDDQVTKLAIRVANRASVLKVKKFIHLSDAHIYQSSSTPAKETSPTDPWTPVAAAHLKAEVALKRIPGLPTVILRPGIVYGPGDIIGLMPRLVVGSVYAVSGEPMKLMHDGEVRINTVHVHDLVRAIVHSCEKLPGGSIYNLADKSDFSVAKINSYMERFYGIKVEFLSKLKNTAAKAAMGTAASAVNDMHMTPWQQLCQDRGCSGTPLTPHLNRELLTDRWLILDGSAVEKTGFKYEYPIVTDELLSAQIHAAIALKHFPEGILKA